MVLYLPRDLKSLYNAPYLDSSLSSSRFLRLIISIISRRIGPRDMMIYVNITIPIIAYIKFMIRLELSHSEYLSCRRHTIAVTRYVSI